MDIFEILNTRFLARLFELEHAVRGRYHDLISSIYSSSYTSPFSTSPKMDPALYKSHTTTRGLRYHYFFSPPQSNQRTLLFLHGYPCTSDSWHKQVPFFIAKGYGVLAPDMLGYGGTEKPGVEELDKYSPTGITHDLVDLLEHEKVGRVVSIGHDWCVRHVFTRGGGGLM
jgi:alpha-beta hydrolase superfamily lysophospholipase